jgi:hypothetical protein
MRKQKTRKYPHASGNALLRAYNKAAKFADGTTAREVSAGFIMPADHEGEGFQVFVKVCRFSERLLGTRPETGGLLTK